LHEGHEGHAATGINSIETPEGGEQGREQGRETGPRPVRSTDVNTRELYFSQVELRRRLRLVGEAYSRLLLNCSNFEHTSEDKRFFEFIFEFTRSVTRLAIDKKYWDEMEQSLSYLFRGYMFNNPALRSKPIKMDSNKDLRNSLDPLDEDNTMDNDTNNLYTDGNRNSRTVNKGTTPIEVAKRTISLARRTLSKYRSRVTGAPRARGIRALRRLRKKRLREAASNDATTGLLPSGVTSLFNGGNNGTGGNARQFASRRSMSSVREIINARSPLVSMLLPTPEESSANARMASKLKSKTTTKSNMNKRKKKQVSKVESIAKSNEYRNADVVPKTNRRNRPQQPHRKRGAALFNDV
jgi:hypothetical protein